MKVVLAVTAVSALHLVSPVPAVAQYPSPAHQIAMAVLPLPEASRDSATVLGYQRDTLVTLRRGTNDYICLGDRPGDNRLQVACYHESLEPFMARGRELRAQGVRFEDRRRIRGEEVESGMLKMPERAMLIQLVNSDSETPDSVFVSHVVYLPFATTETTGIPTRSPRGQPFLMDPGQHRTHLMIPGEWKSMDEVRNPRRRRRGRDQANDGGGLDTTEVAPRRGN